MRGKVRKEGNEKRLVNPRPLYEVRLFNLYKIQKLGQVVTVRLDRIRSVSPVLGQIVKKEMDLFFHASGIILAQSLARNK